MSDKRNSDSLLNNNNKKFKNNNVEDIEFRKKIGKGTFSDVYILKNDNTKCIKIYKHYEEYAYLESKFLSSFNCVNIIKFYKQICYKDKPALILEYCELDLWKYLKTSDVNEKFTFAFMQDISNALFYLKYKNIIHLDIKPENVLIKNFDCFKLCDFSSSCYIDKKPTHFELVSLWYRPLEILFKNPNYNFSVDIWSLGCILFELITYKILFYVKDMDEKQLIKKTLEYFTLKDSSEKFINSCIIDSEIKETYYNNEIIPALNTNYGERFENSKFKDLCMKMLKIDFYKRISIDEIVEEIKKMG